MQNYIDRIRDLPFSAVVERGDFHLLSAKEMNHLVGEGRLKAEQLLEYTLNRIQEDQTGAFVEYDTSALERARKIDQTVNQRKDFDPMAGVIGTSKDTYENAEVRRQFAGTQNPGSHPKKEWKAKSDAYMVRWLRNQGVLLTSTTESSNLALDTQVHSVNHPYDENLAARGSSAGAAVAARLLGGIHLASDAAGSARAPMVYNSATCGLMLPYSKEWIQGHKPPLFEDLEGLIDFGRVGFASQYVEDLALVSQHLGFRSEAERGLNKRLLLIEEFGDLSLNSSNANALDRGVQILRDNGFKIDKMDRFGDFEPNELIHVAGMAIGSRIAASIKSGPWKRPFAKAIWSRTLASVILNQMDGYYTKQARKFAQKNPGEFLTGVLEGLRDWERFLKETDEARKRISEVFKNVVEDGYDGILMPLDHAGQFKKCSTLEPIEGNPYFDATAGLSAVANMALETSALAIPTGHFSGLPNGLQVVSFGQAAVQNALQIGQILQVNNVLSEDKIT